MKLRAPLLPSWLRWLVAIGIAAFIFYVSIVTAPPETVVDKGKPYLIQLDKWRHFVAYAVLGYALAYATTDWDLDVRHLAILVIGITVTYGLGIEFAQALLPERYYGIGDALANAIGGLLVISWYVVIRNITFIPVSEFSDHYLG